MPGRLLVALFVAVSANVLIAQAGRTPTVTSAEAGRATAQAAAAKLYDTSVLHRIDVVIPQEDAGKIINRTDVRIRCTFTLDGLTLKDVGVRQAGGVYHAYVPIQGKPSLSLKFDEFVKKQRLFGLDKLVLKNELQDYSLVNEHLTYEIFRRAGLAAPMTAHAAVTINGIDSGIYLMREPVDNEFLVRNFGKGLENGNLYEIENTREFVYDPAYPPLDDEGKDGRNRNDLVKFAAAIRATTPASFVADLSPYLDIDRFVRYVAAEAATSHWDGLTGRNNNTYIYAHPKDGRFIFIPYGADQAMGASRGAQSWVFEQPRSYLVQKLLAVPQLAERFSAEAARISREPVWSQQVLSERLDRVARILATAGTSGRTASDVGRFASYRSVMEGQIRAGGAGR